uniref:Uncharacterized protein n=1 Tax=Oryza glumipatula TaxID=40148 RepID=A0A0E0AJ68_9ORYZ
MQRSDKRTDRCLSAVSVQYLLM